MSHDVDDSTAHMSQQAYSLDTSTFGISMGAVHHASQRGLEN